MRKKKTKRINKEIETKKIKKGENEPSVGQFT